MTWLLIDSLYAAFADSLPPRAREVARNLPYLLKLAPEPGIRFGQVFSHEVTLGAPFLVADAFPQAPEQLVRAAGMAHLLSVVEAFGTDRVADAQVESSAELSEVFGFLREARDAALERTLTGASREGALADARTRQAIAEERGVVAALRPVTLDAYERMSLGKQAVGFPASVALARALGQSERRVAQLERLLAGVWLGLQFEDDVIDWEDDWSNGGAWAACIARGMREANAAPDDKPTEPDLIRRAVLSTGALRAMLELARRRYRVAWRHAQALGARRLATWARERTDKVSALIPLEAKYAGYTVRARKLAPWAVEVLA